MRHIKAIMRALTSLVSVIILVSLVTAYADDTTRNQTVDIAEPEREVPEVDQFMASFRPVLQAKMDDDFQTVRDSVPVLVAKMKALMKAELPPFYSDVRDLFDKNRMKLAESMKALEEASKSDIDSLLAEGVENVRTNFVEVLITLSAQIKEIDDFHEVLRPLWHEAVPNQDYEAIKAAIPDLKKLADALVKAELPKKYEFLQKEFDEKRLALKVSVDSLEVVCRGTDNEAIESRMIDMHEAYHALTECLE
jgi:hypothetical protein